MKSIILSLCFLFSVNAFAAESSVEVSEGTDLQKSVIVKFIAAINEANNGSNVGGKGSDEAKISCFSSPADTYCDLTNLEDSSKQGFLEMSDSSDEEKAVVVQVIHAMNDVYREVRSKGEEYKGAKIYCFSSEADTFCTITSI